MCGDDTFSTGPASLGVHAHIVVLSGAADCSLYTADEPRFSVNGFVDVPRPPPGSTGLPRSCGKVEIPVAVRTVKNLSRMIQKKAYFLPIPRRVKNPTPCPCDIVPHKDIIPVLRKSDAVSVH